MEKIIPQIIHKEEGFLVLNKPAGMIVNNADTSRDEYTVQDFIAENFTLDKSAKNESEFLSRGGIVHRLDKETSGALIVALDEEFFVLLQKQFKEKKVKKEYLALVHGKLVPEGEINVPIGRLPWNRMRFGVIPQGRESYTKFKVLQYKTMKEGNRSEILSLVTVFPQTGRTHQIRVHMQYAGHPIFADSLYAGRKNIVHDRKFLKRHFLHASKISFSHPASDKELTFEAPLSQELVDFLGTLA
jgi:23S rRNA pseudouridine1911/1915/1917 synthase